MAPRPVRGHHASQACGKVALEGGYAESPGVPKKRRPKKPGLETFARMPCLVAVCAPAQGGRVPPGFANAWKLSEAGLQLPDAFADLVVVLSRQHIVALMQPIAFAAAQLNVALRDGAVSPIPVISPRDGARA